MTLPPNLPANGVMTPNRHTAILFDIDEVVIGDPGFAQARRGEEVARPSAAGQADESNYQNVYFWKSLQAWTLKPIQTDINKLRERDVYQPLIIKQQTLRTGVYVQAPIDSGTPPTSGLKEEFTYHPPTDLPGVTGGLVQASSDPFIGKLVTAPGTFDLHIAPTIIPSPDGDIPVDRIAESFDSFRANQAFFIRWHMGGIPHDNPSLLQTFFFGQYALGYWGDGKATLYEIFPGDPNLRVRLRFRYCQPSEVSNKAHTTAIWPTVGSDGKRYIVFANAMLEAAGSSVAVQNNAIHSDSGIENVYNADSGLRDPDPDQSPGLITKAGIIALEMRRDLKIQFQLSMLGFETDGTLIDQPMHLDQGAVAQPVVSMDKVEYPGTSITSGIFDATTRLPYDHGESLYVQFAFHGSGTDTPILHGYRVTKDAGLTVVSPGQFAAYNWGNVTLNSYDGDPQSQTGNLVVRDPLGVHTRLRNRGRLSCKVQTTFTPTGSAPGAGTEQNVVLHQGYVWRPSNTKKGKPGGFNNSPYPSPEYRKFELPLLGMWKRLVERVQSNWMRVFVIDNNAPPDPVTKIPPPWKITDVIRVLLKACGFSDDQIAIPDIDIRLYPGKTGTPAETQIQPEVGFAEVITRLAKNYLGRYIQWDGNAGSSGQWRLIAGLPFFTSPPTGVGSVINPPTPVAHFVTAPANSITPPHILGAYAENTYPVFGEVEEIVVPPDFNIIHVWCPFARTGRKKDVQICNTLHNPKSFNVPGFPEQADPEHPDFIGYPVPFMIIDSTLAGTAIGNFPANQVTQAAVDFLCNRFYDFLCHGQRIKQFRAPLAFIFDPEIGKYRPLQFQDPVSYNGVTYLVKSCRPEYDEDVNQQAGYELILPVTDAQ